MYEKLNPEDIVNISSIVMKSEDPQFGQLVSMLLGRIKTLEDMLDQANENLYKA